MLAKLSKFYMQFSFFLLEPRVQKALKWLLFISVLCAWKLGWANEGTDLLANTDGNFKATVKGSGRKYAYAIDGLLSLAMYIKTKNMLVLFGSFLVIAVFFEVLLKFVG